MTCRFGFKSCTYILIPDLNIERLSLIYWNLVGNKVNEINLLQFIGIKLPSIRFHALEVRAALYNTKISLSLRKGVKEVI